MDPFKRDKIEKEAREILSKFSKSLNKVSFKEKSMELVLGGFREESSNHKTDEGFREKMFANAPVKEGDFLIAEKKKW